MVYETESPHDWVGFHPLPICFKQLGAIFSLLIWVKYNRPMDPSCDSRHPWNSNSVEFSDPLTVVICCFVGDEMLPTYIYSDYCITVDVKNPEPGDRYLGP